MAIFNPTDISLIFLGILIVMVLLEVRKLSRKPEPVSRLEEQFERLTQQMERIGAPPDIQLPGGAQIVEAGGTFETISEQLERLGESTEDLEESMLGEEGVKRFLKGLQQLREDVSGAQELFERSARSLGQASDAMLSAGSALQRIEARLENVIVPAAKAGRQENDGKPKSGRKDGPPAAAEQTERPPEAGSSAAGSSSEGSSSGSSSSGSSSEGSSPATGSGSGRE